MLSKPCMGKILVGRWFLPRFIRVRPSLTSDNSALGTLVFDPKTKRWRVKQVVRLEKQGPILHVCRLYNYRNKGDPADRTARPSYNGKLPCRAIKAAEA